MYENWRIFRNSKLIQREYIYDLIVFLLFIWRNTDVEYNAITFCPLFAV